jgi:hypothetical protein
VFFVNAGSVVAVSIKLTPSFSAGNPTKLFDARSILLDGRFIASGTHRTYDVSPDGQRFLMIKDNTESGDGSRRLP